jgi:predicted SAM-dependent methyltransferase
MLQELLFVIKSRGFKGIISAVNKRISPPKANCLELCVSLVANKVGLEIGGPSGVFQERGILPIYSVVSQLDNCNFSGKTTWEGEITEGLTFQFAKDKKPGQQYVSEATDLSKINGDKYDFILSSHMLEHTANPFKALSEWTRVLKNDGILIILLPHKEGTFDHKRPVTTLDHMIEDFTSGMKEDDLTHLPEILELHDLSQDSSGETFQSFKTRSEKNPENRCLHQHVFDTKLAVETVNHHHLQIHAVEALLPCHIILVCQKVSQDKILKNEFFLHGNADYRQLSPFALDKLF